MSPPAITVLSDEEIQTLWDACRDGVVAYEMFAHAVVRAVIEKLGAGGCETIRLPAAVPVS